MTFLSLNFYNALSQLSLATYHLPYSIMIMYVNNLPDGRRRFLGVDVSFIYN